MNQFILEKDMLKAFDKAIDLDIIKHNLNNLENKIFVTLFAFF